MGLSSLRVPGPTCKCCLFPASREMARTTLKVRPEPGRLRPSLGRDCGQGLRAAPASRDMTEGQPTAALLAAGLLPKRPAPSLSLGGHL